MKHLISILLLVILVLVACTSSPEIEETASEIDDPVIQVQTTEILPAEPTFQVVETTAVAEETDTPEPATEIPVANEEKVITAEPPTFTPVPLPTALPPVQVISSQTEEGAFFLGDLNAPLTVIDYSDFL